MRCQVDRSHATVVAIQRQPDGRVGYVGDDRTTGLLSIGRHTIEHIDGGAGMTHEGEQAWLGETRPSATG
jgi:hypothetical protein